MNKLKETGRLYGSRVYLVGPIDRAKDNGVEWRKALTPFLKEKGIVVLDPTDKKIDMGLENIENRERRLYLKQTKQYDLLSQEIRLLRRVDLRQVDISDFIIVNLDIEIPMSGTAEEIFWANRLKHPVIIMCPQGKDRVFDWLWGTLDHNLFFNNWDEVKGYINQIDNPGYSLSNDKRWILFDYKNL